MQSPKSRLRMRFWIESALAAATGLLALLTAIWRDWLELVGVDPDNHSGSTEWQIVGVLFVCFLAFAVAARVEWRRTASACEN
jgi:hypothetical protein